MRKRKKRPMKQGPIARESASNPLTFGQLALVGTIIAFAAYTTVLSIGHDSSVRDALPGSAVNTIPTVFFGVIAYQIIRGWLIKQPLPVQLFGHLVLCGAYALFTYWLLVVLLGAISGVSVIRFNVVPFPVRASVWQMLEDATVYGIIAALAYRGTANPEVTVVLNGAADETRPGFSRYFIRSGDEIQPVDVDLIVSIAGADDYAEVATLKGKHLVRMTLAEFEKSLDPARFIRVHRSRIVNFERIVRAEPAGNGRMLLHMEDGEAIVASRAGSRLLRDRVI
jgi:two-component system, LytTR family, response regulator